MNTIVINLVGGPCCGKSTIASELFSRLKKMGIKCELCTEYIKERIYEENQTIAKEQIALFGAEHYKIWNKLGKVDVIVKDGSFISNIIYKKEDNPEFDALILSEYNKCNNLTFFLNRGTLEFENYGRIHNLAESLKLDEQIKNIHKKYNLPYIEIESRDAADKIIPILLNKIKEETNE